MPDTCVIFNPAADRGRLARKVEALRDAVGGRADVRWLPTERRDHATELAERAGRDGGRCVVALGGDGTVHEVANGLMGLTDAQRPVMGVVPMGSGNDFAHACGIAGDSLSAFDRVFTGTPRPVDVGTIAGNHGQQRFWVNSAGMLLDAAINIQSHRIRRVHGFLMYFLATVRSLVHHYHTTKLRLTIDGQSCEKSLVLFTLANGRREGGGFVIAPEAVNDDGRFDYVWATPISRLRMFATLPRVMKGTHGKCPFITFGRFQTMRIEADRAVPVHLDGELWADYDANVTQLDIAMLPGALKVMR